MKCALCRKRLYDRHSTLISSGYLCHRCSKAYNAGLKDGIAKSMQDMGKVIERGFKETDRELKRIDARLFKLEDSE